MKLLKQMIYLLLVPVLTTGCIKEDMEDCENVSITFRYLADGDTDVLRQYMDKIDLYVFNAQNQLVDKIAYSQDDLAKEEQTPQFRLKPGTYRLVALGNSYQRTKVEGTGNTDFNNIFIQHPNWGTTTPIDSHDHNYMGQKEINVPGDNKYLHETVYLYSSHINVSVEIHGLPAPGATGTRAEGVPYTLTFENANAQTTFNNEIRQGQTETCLPTLHYDSTDGTYRTEDLTLFRMDKDGRLDANLCRHQLQLNGTDGKQLAAVDIYSYLQQYSDVIDVTKQEADLPISINMTPLGVIIEIPSWYVEDIEPDWSR